MRSYFEELERQQLASFAALSGASKGRQFEEPKSENRTCFQRDRDRIIHSKAFRRLKHKTQVFVVTVSDHYRSRLTHTIEVAQISRHLARMFKLNEDLAECIALAHDLGHPPFGHAGERTLNELMVPYGGFEHNLQSRRIVDVLEHKYPLFPGLNLSYEVREGLIKHKTPWDNPQTDTVDGFISLEAKVCNIADEIAYNNHDLDDGLSSGILSESELERHVALWREANKVVDNEYQNIDKKERRALINSKLIGAQIRDVVRESLNRIKKLNITSLDDIQVCNDKIVCFSNEMHEQNSELRRYLFNHFYMNNGVYRMNVKGQGIIKSLFKVYLDDPRLMPKSHQDKIDVAGSKARVVCDYIAGMTDTFASKELDFLGSQTYGI